MGKPPIPFPLTPTWFSVLRNGSNVELVSNFPKEASSTNGVHPVSPPSKRPRIDLPSEAIVPEGHYTFFPETSALRTTSNARDSVAHLRGAPSYHFATRCDSPPAVNPPSGGPRVVGEQCIRVRSVSFEEGNVGSIQPSRTTAAAVSCVSPSSSSSSGHFNNVNPAVHEGLYNHRGTSNTYSTVHHVSSHSQAALSPVAPSSATAESALGAVSTPTMDIQSYPNKVAERLPNELGYLYNQKGPPCSPRVPLARPQHSGAHVEQFSVSFHAATSGSAQPSTSYCSKASSSSPRSDGPSGLQSDGLRSERKIHNVAEKNVSGSVCSNNLSACTSVHEQSKKKGSQMPLSQIVCYVNAEVKRLKTIVPSNLDVLERFLDSFYVSQNDLNGSISLQLDALQRGVSECLLEQQEGASSFLSQLEAQLNVFETYALVTEKDTTSNNAATFPQAEEPLAPDGVSALNKQQLANPPGRRRSWIEYYDELRRASFTRLKSQSTCLFPWLDFPSMTALNSTDTGKLDACLGALANRRWARLFDFQQYLRTQMIVYRGLLLPPGLTPYLNALDDIRSAVVTQLPPLLSITARESRRTKTLARYRTGAQTYYREQEERKRGRSDFVKEVLRHRARFVEFHARNGKIMKRLAHYVVRTVMTTREKRDVLAASSSESQFNKERLAALKANDEVQYMKLLRETKNHRLLELVRQTEDYMKKLGHLVTQHRENEQQRYRNFSSSAATPSTAQADHSAMLADTRSTPVEVQAAASHSDSKASGSETNTDDMSSYDALITAKNHYFTLTHNIQEEILRIPSCLVGGELREYQLKGLAWMVSLYNNNLNGILADAMGLGKTIQTIALLAYLYEVKRNKGPFLIVAPLSTLHSGWNTEFNRWLPSFVKVVYDGSKEVRKALRQKYFGDSPSFNVLLTTDSFIMKDCTHLRRVHWEYLIVDEAHRLKNPKSKLVQVLTDKRQTRGFRIKRRLALTGTPLQNDLQEVWALLNFLMPTIFCSSETFRSWFNAPLGQSGSQHQVDVTEEEQLLVVDRLHKVLRPFLLRREKKEVENEVPRKHEEILWCPMSGVQHRLYRDIERGETPAGVSVSSNTLMQLRKVCNHPYLFCPKTSVGPEIPTDESVIRLCGKFWVLDDILPKLQAAGHRVLIFSQMVKLLNILEIFLSLRGWKFLRLDGSTSSEERLRRLSLFNAPNSPYFVFALSTKAGGLGVNLQSADTVIIYDSDWNPQNDEQAQSRAHRIGQTKEVLTLRLVTANTVEERILSAAGVKLDKDALVIKSGMFYDSGNDLEDERRNRVRAILSKKNHKQEVTFYERGAVNRILARTKEELHTFSRVDRIRKALALGDLMMSTVFPPCLARLDRHPTTPAKEDEWRSTFGRDCPWAAKHKGACPTALPPQVYSSKKLAINNAVYESLQVVTGHRYKGCSPEEVQPFLALPDPKECPGYQDIVKFPMCLNFVKAFAERRNFSSLMQVEKYLSRIASNCRLFNGPDHYLFYQALRVMGAVLHGVRERCCRAFAAIEQENHWRTKEDVDRLNQILDRIDTLEKPSGQAIYDESLIIDEEEEELTDTDDLATPAESCVSQS